MKTQAGHGDAQCTCGSTYIHKRVTREYKRVTREYKKPVTILHILKAFYFLCTCSFYIFKC